jgi:hypothetical protein
MKTQNQHSMKLFLLNIFNMTLKVQAKKLNKKRQGQLA